MKKKKEHIWGFVGKIRKFEILTETEPELTIEERRKALLVKQKNWTADVSKMILAGGYVPGSTPPVETYNLQTAQGDNLLTAQGDNLIWNIT